MMRFAAAYATTLVVMLLVDLPWITVIAKSMYREGIGHLMADNANLPAAVAFYLIYDWHRMILTVDGWIPLQQRVTVRQLA